MMLDVARQTDPIVVIVRTAFVHLSDIHVLGTTILARALILGVPRTPKDFAFTTALRTRRGVHAVSLIALAVFAFKLIDVTFIAAVSFTFFARRVMVL